MLIPVFYDDADFHLSDTFILPPLYDYICLLPSTAPRSKVLYFCAKVAIAEWHDMIGYIYDSKSVNGFRILKKGLYFTIFTDR